MIKLGDVYRDTCLNFTIKVIGVPEGAVTVIVTDDGGEYQYQHQYSEISLNYLISQDMFVKVEGPNDNANITNGAT